MLRSEPLLSGFDVVDVRVEVDSLFDPNRLPWASSGRAEDTQTVELQSSRTGETFEQAVRPREGPILNVHPRRR